MQFNEKAGVEGEYNKTYAYDQNIEISYDQNMNKTFTTEEVIDWLKYNNWRGFAVALSPFEISFPSDWLLMVRILYIAKVIIRFYLYL